MPEPSLQGRRVLVVEDEYVLASDLCDELEGAGAIVVGPAPTLEAALALLDDGARLDGAVLDVNLGGVMVFPLADLLVERQAPFVFTTGYDAGALPERFAAIINCEKPADTGAIRRAIAGAMQSRGPPART